MKVLPSGIVTAKVLLWIFPVLPVVVQMLTLRKFIHMPLRNPLIFNFFTWSIGEEAVFSVEINGFWHIQAQNTGSSNTAIRCSVTADLWHENAKKLAVSSLFSICFLNGEEFTVKTPVLTCCLGCHALPAECLKYLNAGFLLKYISCVLVKFYSPVNRPVFNC